MELFTSSVFSAGSGQDPAYIDQVLLLPRYGLLAVADAPGGADDGRAGIRIAIDTVRAHVERNDDILQRFRRNPSADLRKRILDFIEEAFAYAAQFVPPGRASKAAGLIKRAVQTGAEVPLGEGLALERELQQQLFLSADSKEGIRAYVEKSKAHFQGN